MNVNLKELVYTQPHRGWPHQSNQECTLYCVLYSLKQVLHAKFEKLGSINLGFGLIHSLYDLDMFIEYIIEGIVLLVPYENDFKSRPI